MVAWLGALLTRDTDRAVATVTASFTPQAQLLHPLAHFQSRQEVAKVGHSTQPQHAKTPQQETALSDWWCCFVQIYSVVSRACRDITVRAL